MYGLCHASDAEDVGRDTHGHLSLDVNLQHVAEGCFHYSFQAVVDILRLPEQVLLVLHPFKVRDGDAAGVAQNVRNDEDTFAFKDSVCGRR